MAPHSSKERREERRAPATGQPAPEQPAQGPRASHSGRAAGQTVHQPPQPSPRQDRRDRPFAPGEDGESH